MTDHISVEAVRIHREAVREDLGDIDALAESIREVGLIQPIIIDQRSFLLSGKRRLEAVRQLGMRTIPVIVADTLDNACEAMAAQLLEPTQRKAMVPSEQVRATKALVNLIPPKKVAKKGEGRSLKERRAVHNRRGETIGAAVGMGRSSLYYAREVVERAEGGDEAAVVALKEMDATGLIRPAYYAMKGKEMPSQGFASGHKVRLVRSSKPMDQRLTEVAAQLRGLTIGLDSMTEEELKDVDATARRRLETELRQSSSRINRFRKLLKGQS